MSYDTTVYLNFQNAISRINFLSGGTNTAYALNKTVLDFQASSRWNDDCTYKVLVLITDGRYAKVVHSN